MEPNYDDLGLSICMGQKLRKEVEIQLINDLKDYGIYSKSYKFDWSNSCIEGHATKYLDGIVENFSGILIFNDLDELIADGWMEFIHEKDRDLFIVYWEFLDVFINGQEVVKKDKPGVPKQIIDLLPFDLKEKYKYL